MIVMKFGGTSVGSAARIASTVDIIARAEEPALVVVSAMSGITNRLEAVVRGEESKENILADHIRVAEELGIDVPEFTCRAQSILDSAHTPGEIKACGEKLSSELIILHMQARGMDAVLLDALSFMKTDVHSYPDLPAIKTLSAAALHEQGSHRVYLTQGFICSLSDGQVSTLSRGGSDYTATLLGEAFETSEIQIWTDVDGVFSADPRLVPHAHSIDHLNYDIASQAAYFGAKILHHSCVNPALRGMIPLKVLNSFNPESSGTLIDSSDAGSGFKIVASMIESDAAIISLIGSDSSVSDKDIRNVAGEDCKIFHQLESVTNVVVPRHREKEVIIALHDNFITK